MDSVSRNLLRQTDPLSPIRAKKVHQQSHCLPQRYINWHTHQQVFFSYTAPWKYILCDDDDDKSQGRCWLPVKPQLYTSVCAQIQTRSKLVILVEMQTNTDLAPSSLISAAVFNHLLLLIRLYFMSQPAQAAPEAATTQKAEAAAENVMTVAKDPRYARYLKMVQVVSRSSRLLH